MMQVVLPLNLRIFTPNVRASYHVSIGLFYHVKNKQYSANNSNQKRFITSQKSSALSTLLGDAFYRYR